MAPFAVRRAPHHHTVDVLVPLECIGLVSEKPALELGSHEQLIPQRVNDFAPYFIMGPFTSLSFLLRELGSEVLEKNGKSFKKPFGLPALTDIEVDGRTQRYSANQAAVLIECA
jgi:hypothetical protein